MAGFLDYSEGATALHRANPLTKIAFAVSICVATFLASDVRVLLLFILLELLVGLYAGIGKKTISLLGGFAVLGCVMFVIQTAVVRDGTAVFLFMTDRGIDTGAHVALRLIAFALPLMQMLTLTRPVDLSNAAVEVLHIPYRYAFTITTALRFVPIFASEMSQIIEAQTARGVGFDEARGLHKLRLMLPLAAPLLISSVAKADDTALAAEERGFYLRTRRSSYKRYPFRAVDLSFFVIAALIIVVGALF
ncbi:MAG: energy-coupling factor transporter transmembrane component T [Atopobiaceae bacterium]|jgi:energy-coupling factor transport system permease protein|nr:energy-coupling factor transporter transmembrane protein EcfT [Olegusella sp.]